MHSTIRILKAGIRHRGAKCRRCRKEILEGELIVSAPSNHRVKHYHKRCYDNMWLDL